MQTRIALRGDRGTSGAWLDCSGTLCSLSLTGLDSPYSCQSWASCPLFPSPQAPSCATPAAAPCRACVSGVRPMGGGKEGRSRGISLPLSSSGSFSGHSCVSSRRGPSCRSSFQKPWTRCGYPNLQIDKPRLPAAKKLCKVGRVATIGSMSRPLPVLPSLPFHLSPSQA